MALHTPHNQTHRWLAELQEPPIIQIWNRLEVEAIEAFDGGELGGFDLPLHHSPLAVYELQLRQPGQVTDMVYALRRTDERPNWGTFALLFT